jgi:small multidrug resistance family-3 protein
VADIFYDYGYEKRKPLLGTLGGIILFGFGIIPTLQTAEFGRVYAAYSGIFIVSAIIWGRIVDKKKPDSYEIIGSIAAVVGAIINFLCVTLKLFYFNMQLFMKWK